MYFLSIANYDRNLVLAAAKRLVNCGTYKDMWDAEVVRKIDEVYDMVYWTVKRGMSGLTPPTMVQKVSKYQAHLYMIQALLELSKAPKEHDVLEPLKMVAEYNVCTEPIDLSMIRLIYVTDEQIQSLRPTYCAYRLFENSKYVSQIGVLKARALGLGIDAIRSYFDRRSVREQLVYLTYLLQNEDKPNPELYWILYDMICAKNYDEKYLAFWQVFWLLHELCATLDCEEQLAPAALWYILKRRDIVDVMNIRGVIISILE